MEKVSIKSEIAKKIIVNTERELYLSFPFLSLAFGNLDFKEDDIVGLATDGENIYYNADYLLEVYEKNDTIANEILHTIIHLMFRHFAKSVSRENKRINDIAADIAVAVIIENSLAKDDKTVASKKRKAIISEFQKYGETLNSEHIALYFKKFSESRLSEMKELFYVDDHSMWKTETDGNAEGTESGAVNYKIDYKLSSHDSQMEKKWEELADKTLVSAMSFGVSNDNASPFIEALRINRSRRYDYRSFLKKFLSVKETIKISEDEFDYIYYTYGLMHYKNMPLYENLEYRDDRSLSDVFIAVDTSGSTKGELVKKFLQETYSVIETCVGNHEKINVKIIQCDDRIREIYSINTREDFLKTMDSFKLLGGGGTDFTKVFEYIDGYSKENRHKVRGLIYFTDGNGLFPKTAPYYKTAFVFYDDFRNNYDVPPWCIKLIVGKEEFENEHS